MEKGSAYIRRKKKQRFYRAHVHSMYKATKQEFAGILNPPKEIKNNKKEINDEEHCNSQHPIEFSVASCNILAQKPYKRWRFDPKTHQRFPTLPWETRVSYVIRALTESCAFAESDILCFQEFPLSSSDHLPPYLPDKLKQLGYTWQIYPQKPNYFGCVICWKRKIFMRVSDPINYTFKCHSGSGFLAIVLEDRRYHTKKSIGVICTHMPFGKTVAALSEICDFINLQNWKELNGYILCGDFNSDDILSMGAIFKKYENTIGSIVSTNTTQEKTHRSGTDKHVQYDFIFYNHLSQIVPLTIFPTDFNNLLSHISPQIFDDISFFSDHAILRTKFSLKYK